MTLKQINKDLEDGLFVFKTSYTKFKRGKIVRGSFYDYHIGETKITERQFEAIEHKLSIHEKGGFFGETIYKLKND